MWAVSLPQARPGSTGSCRPFRPAAAVRKGVALQRLYFKGGGAASGHACGSPLAAAARIDCKGVHAWREACPAAWRRLARGQQLLPAVWLESFDVYSARPLCNCRWSQCMPCWHSQPQQLLPWHADGAPCGRCGGRRCPHLLCAPSLTSQGVQVGRVCHLQRCSVTKSGVAHVAHAIYDHKHHF